MSEASLPTLDSGLEGETASFEEIEAWLVEVQNGTAYYEVQFTLAGYTFELQRNRAHEPAPTVWKVFCRCPSETADLDKIPERLGYFWDWRIAISVIIAELSSHLS